MSYKKKKRITSEEKIENIKDQSYHIKDVSVYSKVHYHILKEVHLGLRILSFKYQLPMSQIIRELIEKLVLGDPYLLNIVAEMKEREQEEIYKDMVDFEAESIYKVLEQFEEKRNKEKEEEIDCDDNESNISYF